MTVQGLALGWSPACLEMRPPDSDLTAGRQFPPRTLASLKPTLQPQLQGCFLLGLKDGLTARLLLLSLREHALGPARWRPGGLATEHLAVEIPSSSQVPSTQEKLCPEAAVVPRTRKRELTSTVWGVSKSKKPQSQACQERVLSLGQESSFRNSKK